MQITESQLRQQVRTLLKEEVYGTIATVYHGSRQSPEEFLKIFETGDGSSYQSTGWQHGKGAGSMYGHGLYSVWTKTGHATFTGGYGRWIYKLKVNLWGFIIFDEDICKRVYKRSISPLEQMKLIGKTSELKHATEEEIEFLSSPLVSSNTRSAALAQNLKNFLLGRVNGLVFFGSHDGPVVLIYDPDIVTPLAYSYLSRRDDQHEWTRWNASEIKSSLKRVSLAGMQTNTERLQTKNNFVDVDIAKRSLKYLRKVYNKLDDRQKSKIIRETEDEQIASTFLNDPDEYIKMQTWGEAKLPRETFMTLASSADKLTTRSVGHNPHAPPEVLEKLSSSEDHSTRYAVAANPSTPDSVIQKLMNDSNLGILQAIASRENISKENFKKLVDSDNLEVLKALMWNASLPEDLLMSFVEGTAYQKLAQANLNWRKSFNKTSRHVV